MFIRKQHLCVLILLSSSLSISSPTWGMDPVENKDNTSIRYLKQAFDEVNNMIPTKRKQGIALVGMTKSGKSTLLNYLCDVPMHASKKGGLYVVETEEQKSLSSICHIATSGTTLPIIRGDYYDFAGFQTIPGSGKLEPLAQDIINSYSLYKLLTNTKNIKIALVTKEDKIPQLIPAIQQLIEMFPSTDLTQALSLVVTNRRDAENIPLFIAEVFQGVPLTDPQKKIITSFSRKDSQRIAAFDRPKREGKISEDNKEEIKRAINNATYLEGLKPKLSMLPGSEYLIKNLVTSVVDEISHLTLSFSEKIYEYCESFKERPIYKKMPPQELRETFKAIADPLKKILGGMSTPSEDFDNNIEILHQVLKDLSPDLGKQLSDLKETLNFFELIKPETLYLKKNPAWAPLEPVYFYIKKLAVVPEEIKQEPYPSPTRSLQQQRKYASALSLDGGGIRGYMQALWIDYLEKKTNRRTHQLFDRIDGTSIGGILSLGLMYPDTSRSKPKLSTQDLINLFTEKGEQIFPQRWEYNFIGKVWDRVKHLKSALYDPAPLEQLLKSYFADDTFDTLLKPVGVVSLDALTHNPMHLENSDPQVKKLKLWEVGRSTSAATTYFPAYSCHIGGRKIQLEDGGLYRNNPSALSTLKLLKDGRKIDSSFSHDNIIVLSLGTGKVHQSLLNIVEPYAGKLPAVWNGRIIETIMNASSIGVHQSMKGTLSSANYKRINPTLTRNIELNHATQENYKFLQEVAKEGYNQLDEFISGDSSNFRYILEHSDARLF